VHLVGILKNFYKVHFYFNEMWMDRSIL